MQPATFDKCNLQLLIQLKKRLRHKFFPTHFAKFFETDFYRTSPGDCFCYFPFVRMAKGNLTHCVKSVHIRRYSGPNFPAFGLNTERYSVSLRIQSKCGKMRTRITPNADTFYALTGTAAAIFSLSLFQNKDRLTKTTYTRALQKS